MLGSSPVVACLAVLDMEAAKEFYGQTLGLKQGMDGPDGTMFEAGNGTAVFVYQSGFAGTNQATAASWSVEDIAATVAELKNQGVSFEHYDLPGANMEGDVHVIGGMRAAFFKDPWGNILNLVHRG